MAILKFQEGGQVPQGAPAPAQEQDPLMMIAQMASEALQSQDAGLALQVCEGILMLIQEMQGGQPPVGEAPQGEPVFKKGGKIVARKGCKKK